MNDIQEPPATDTAWLDPIAAAEHLNVSPQLLKRLRLGGEGPVSARLSERKVRYRIADLDAWASERLSE